MTLSKQTLKNPPFNKSSHCSRYFLLSYVWCPKLIIKLIHLKNRLTSIDASLLRAFLLLLNRPPPNSGPWFPVGGSTLMRKMSVGGPWNTATGCHPMVMQVVMTVGGRQRGGGRRGVRWISSWHPGTKIGERLDDEIAEFEQRTDFILQFLKLM